MGVELTAAREARKLWKREKNYKSMVAGLYALSFYDCELGKVARASCLLLRNVDDNLDGDRNDTPNPLERVLNLKSQIESGKFDRNNSLSQLAEYAIEQLEKRAVGQDNPRGDFIQSIDYMVFDYDRSAHRRLLNHHQVENYYEKTFLPVINLLFIGLESEMRAADIPQLGYVQARMYTIRDLDEDWMRGTINIPSEILAKAQLSANSTITQVRSSITVSNWFSDQLRRAREEANIATRKLDSLPKREFVTKKIGQSIIKPTLKFIENSALYNS